MRLQLRHAVLTGMVLVILASAAGAVQVTVPDSAMPFGTTSLLPVFVDDVTGLGIIAYQFTLTYDPQVLRIKGVTVVECLGGQWGIPTVNADRTGEVTVVHYSTEPLAGAGTLLKFETEVTGNPGRTSALRFSSFVCNDGNPQAQYADPVASFHVTSDGVPILSIYPDTLDFGSVDTVQYFTVVNLGVSSLVWKVEGSADIPWIRDIRPAAGAGNGVVEVAISRVGLGTGLYTGSLAVSSNGGRMDLAAIMTVAQEYDVIAVSLPDTSQYKSRMVEIPVRVADLTGMGVIAYSFSLLYDESVVNIVGASSQGTLSAAWGEPTVNTDTTGQITVSHLASTPLVGDGSLVSLICYAVGNPGDSSYLSFSRFAFNDGYPLAEWDTPSAVFSVDTADVPLLFLSPTVLDFGAAKTVKAFHVLNLGAGRLEWTVVENPQQPWIELVSPASGTGEGPVMIGVSRIGLPAGLYSSQISVVSNGGEGDVTVSMSIPPGTRRIQCLVPDSSVAMDGEMVLPLRVDDFSSFGVYDFDFTLLFNESLVQMLGAESDGTLSDSWGTPEVDLSNPGSIRVSHHGELPLSGPGTLVGLRMKAVGNPLDSVALSFSQVSFNGNKNVAQYNTPAAIVTILSPQYPVLLVSTNLLDFGLRSTVKSFTIRNMGQDILSWSVYENPEKTWILQINPTDGTQTQTVTVTVSRQGLVPDVYMGSLYVVSNGGYENIAVRMEVQQTDSLPPFLAFTSPPDGAAYVPRNGPVYVSVEDRDSQVDAASLVALINADTIVANGQDRTGGAVEFYSGEAGVTILYRPPVPFSSGATVFVAVHAEDTALPAHQFDGDFFFNVGQGLFSVSAESTLTPNGGSIEDEIGNLLTLPSGALSDNLMVMIGAVDNAPPLPEWLLPVGKTYLFAPDGLAFCPLPGVGRLAYTQDDLDSAGLVDPTWLVVFSFLSKPGVWEEHQILTIDPDAQTVLFQLCRLGYVRLAVAKAPAVGDDNEDRQSPDCYVLGPNYPNPFNASTRIQYQIPMGNSQAHILLKVYNILGQEMATLADGAKQPGYHTVTWDGHDAGQREVPSGVYFCRMVVVAADGTMQFESGQKLLLLR